MRLVTFFNVILKKDSIVAARGGQTGPTRRSRHIFAVRGRYGVGPKIINTKWGGTSRFLKNNGAGRF